MNLAAVFVLTAAGLMVVAGLFVAAWMIWEVTRG